MNSKRKSLLAISVIASLWNVGPISAEKPDPDEAALVQEEAALNKDGQAPNATRVDSLSKQFGVEPAQVEGLRGKTGWGGATTQLAMAQNLMKTDPVKYPTMTDALYKVEALRAEGKGYGAIAKELGFKLGPVVSATQHARKDMHSAPGHEMSPGQSQKAEKAAKPEKAMKSEKPPKPPKAEKPPKPPKP